MTRAQWELVLSRLVPMLVVLFLVVLASSFALLAWRGACSPSWVALPPGKNPNSIDSPRITPIGSKPGDASTFSTPRCLLRFEHLKGADCSFGCTGSAQTWKGSFGDEASDLGSVANARLEGAHGSDEPSVSPSLRAPRSSGSDSRSLTDLTPSYLADGDWPGPPTSDPMQSFPA